MSIYSEPILLCRKFSSIFVTKLPFIGQVLNNILQCLKTFNSLPMWTLFLLGFIGLLLGYLEIYFFYSSRIQI